MKLCSTYQANCPECPKLVPGIYRHFKTKDLYIVKDDYLHYDVNGEEAIACVNYTRADIAGPSFTRHIDNFTAFVDRANYRGPRFVLVRS